MKSVVIVTGISGSGKSVAIKQLEDLGYYCVDNLPVSLIKNFIDDSSLKGEDFLAAAVDARSHNDIHHLPETVKRMRELGYNVQVLYLDAAFDVLIHRFSETRRAHPLTKRIKNETNHTPSLEECIDYEKNLLSSIKESEQVIDTSLLKPSELRNWIKELINVRSGDTLITFESFGYKYGVPSSADIVFDVRCLPNPYYDAQLKPLTGLDTEVAEWLGSKPQVNEMIEDIATFVRKWLPQYMQDTRSYLTVAIGCTGGQHRSVYIAEKLADIFKEHKPLRVRHRALSHFARV
ncbi:RNase adapter RapZ [Taylorella asinigenitalis]|uniref:Putative P-loop-containing kinase n=1 Tax=Taylorella asinigenitalis (strain MCE3) TaxID=1008459 RepID=G4QDK9_TAYAM|nr:RNase adapter RapZ [Taylorella asinigenitalis]AEP36026.1 putative P-loop-containing kinase [Taylorella asinigenitalis MCE3]